MDLFFKLLLSSARQNNSIVMVLFLRHSLNLSHWEIFYCHVTLRKEKNEAKYLSKYAICIS